MDFISLCLLILFSGNEWSLEDLTILIAEEQDKSDDSFLPILQCVLYAGTSNDRRTGRQWWIFPKSESWWTDLLQEVWSKPELDRDALWQQRFRMSYSLFMKLVHLIQPFMPPISEWPLARKRLELEKCVALVLYRLAHNVSLLELSDKFHVGQAGVVKYTRLIVEILSNRSKLLGRFIRLPRGARLEIIMDRFYRLSNVPFIAGSIDGCQIKLKKKPHERHNPAEYWNRHHDFAVLLQGVCDADRNFLDVACLFPGSQHDAAHLRVSSLWHKLTNNLVYQEPTMQLELPQRQSAARQGITVKPYIIGDAAYPLTQYIQKAFDTRRTGSQLRNDYDKALRSSRVRIEHAFGLLKQRWQICQGGMTVRTEEVSSTVIACCMLHNFCNYGGVELLPAECEADLTFDPFRDSEPYLTISENVHRHRTREGKRLQQALFRYWQTETVGN